jgi:predicted PurR-regulated permease PerM
MTGRRTRGSGDHDAEDLGMQSQPNSADNGATVALTVSNGGAGPGDEEAAAPAADQPVRPAGRLRAAVLSLRRRVQAATAQASAARNTGAHADAMAADAAQDTNALETRALDTGAPDTGAPDTGAPGTRPRADAAPDLTTARDTTAPDPTARDTTVQAGPVPRAAGAPRDAQTVPRLLQQLAAWSWRLLLVGLLIYVAFRLASALRLVVLPCFAAMLLTALLQPLTARLRRAGLPSLAATWCTILAAIAVLAGVGTLAANRVSADYPQLSDEVRHTARQVQVSLAGPPFHVSSVRLQQYSNELVQFLTQHKSLVAGTVVTGGKIVLELLTGFVLTMFITFFLLKDGQRIWGWLVSGLGRQAKKRAGNAGWAAWTALVNYVRGTTIVAAIHAVLIGLALWILGVPLLIPLIILVFVAAFVPLIGILVVGALAILVTLGTKGWLAAVILLAVFLLENQIESHLLQPLVVGRIVRLHPLAIILVLAVGGIVAGIAGAIVAVPSAAAISYAWPYLRGREPEPPAEPKPPPPP